MQCRRVPPTPRSLSELSAREPARWGTYGLNLAQTHPDGILYTPGATAEVQSICDLTCCYYVFLSKFRD